MASFEEDLMQKRNLFNQVAKPCYDEMLRLQERHMNPVCALSDGGVEWKLDEDVQGVMDAYKKHVKELWYQVFGFEMEEC